MNQSSPMDAAQPAASLYFPNENPMALPCGVDLYPNVRTLADIGLTEARAWALAQYTRPLRDDHLPFEGLCAERARPLFERFGFAVTLTHVRQQSAEDYGEVIVWHMDTGRECGFCIGAMDPNTGRFMTNIDLSEREWHEATPRKVADRKVA